MPAPVKPVVYNQTNYHSWTTELPQVEDQIERNSQVIEANRPHLRILEDQLGSVDSLISSAQFQLTAANVSAAQDMMSHHGHHHRHHHHHGFGDGVIHAVGDAMRLATIGRLRAELDSLNRRRDALIRQMSPYQQVINTAETAQAQLRSRRVWLQRHIPAALQFLPTLQDNPATFVANLQDSILKAFTKYEDTHFTGLSPQVRISLIAVRYGLDSLVHYQRGYTPAYENEQHRTNYLRLCGFLWDMYQKVKAENKDEQFEAILKELVESTHILQDGDIPDQMHTGHSARAWFQANQQQKPEYFAILETDLSGIEQQIYDSQLDFFKRDGLRQNTPLERHIFKATQLIEAEIETKKHNKEEIDYHFYARSLRSLEAVYLKPTDKEAAKRLADLSEHASGSVSIGKQVAGSLLIVVGVLLIGASVAGLVTTFGMSSILTAWTMALGLSLLQSQIVLGVGCSVAAASGLGLTFFAGPNTIKAGQRQGLSHELITIKGEVENPEQPPAYSPM